jgi:hypothetical protein
MKPLLQTPLFKIGIAAMAAATACVAVLFLYALHAPTQPEPAAWRTTVAAAPVGAEHVQLSAVADVR